MMMLERPRRDTNGASDDDDVYYYICWRLKLEGETENMGVCTKERKGVAAEVLMATPCTNSLGGESGGHKHGGDVGRRLCWKFCTSSPPFLGRERAAVDVDVGPERRSPRYHETCLALESVKEGSAAVSKPRGVRLRMPIVKNLKEARRLPVRVEEQQAQQLAMNPPRSAGTKSS